MAGGSGAQAKRGPGIGYRVEAGVEVEDGFGAATLLGGMWLIAKSVHYLFR